MTCMTPSQVVDTTNDLRVYLEELRNGAHDVIEYGVPDQQSAFYTRLRIRWMKTAGGPQWQLRTVNSLGQEGSGYYSTNAEYIVAQAMQEVQRYHMPSTNSKVRKALALCSVPAPKVTDFMFYPASMSAAAVEEKRIFDRVNSDFAKVFEDFDTITLSNEDRG